MLLNLELRDKASADEDLGHRAGFRSQLRHLLAV